MRQGNQNVAFVILIFAVGLGGYLWGHNVGLRMATAAVLEAVKQAPPMPATNSVDPNVALIAVLELMGIIDVLKRENNKLHEAFKAMRDAQPRLRSPRKGAEAT